MIKLHSFGPAFGLIDASPFVIKVKLFMTLHSIDFEEVCDAEKLSKAPKQKFPYIEDGETRIADSSAIIDYLSLKHSLDMDSWLTDEQRALSHLLGKSLEENLYWCLVHSRWVDQQTWPKVRSYFFDDMPFPLNKIVPKIARSGTIKRINGHGMGAHSNQEILDIADQSFSSLSVLLGNKPYFFGDQLSNFDLIAFSQVAAHTLCTLDSPMIELSRQHKNLVSYTQRIQDKHFSSN